MSQPRAGRRVPRSPHRRGPRHGSLPERVRHFPSSPRCKLCMAPFEGIGGAVLRRFGFARFPGNPAICQAASSTSAERADRSGIPVSLLFADVRGSTGIAEGMRPAEFRSFLDGFYRDRDSEVILRHDGLVDKLVGDEIIGLFFGGITGPRHASGRDRGGDRARCIGSGESDASPSGADPTRRRCPYGRGVRGDDRPGGSRRRLHGARRCREHDGPAGVECGGRRDPRHRCGSRCRRIRRRAGSSDGTWRSVAATSPSTSS